MRLHDLFETRKAVAEGAPELLKAEMPLVRHIEKELTQHGYEKGTAEYNEHFKHALAYYRKFGNVDAIKQGVAEGEGSKSGPYEQGGTDAWYHRGFDPKAHGYEPGTEEYREYKRGFDQNDFGPQGGKQY